MKKACIYLLAVLFISFTACNQNGPDNGDPTVADITVYLPDDLEEFDLLYDNQQKQLEFEWDNEDEGVEYSILFSLDDEMNNPKTISVGTELTKKLTHAELDAILGELGVKEYNRGDLYWKIQGKKEGAVANSEVRSMKLFRFYKPFVDPRDNETYRVCRVVDPLTGNYAVWLADNLRATKYSDGTPVEGYKFYTPQEGEDDSWIKTFGAYYTWTAVMKGTKGAEEGEKIQGIAPEGWHIPTSAEWVFLINACDEGDGPGTALKDKTLWDPTATNIGTNSIGFNMAATGYIWEVPVNDVIEPFANTYFWTATAPQEGDVFPWDPNPANFPNQAVTYGFNKNDFGAALYPYDRTRGFSLRCVMD
ncbi:hypothetical protein D0T49_05965 [Paludibacter sp. 221]|uniref:FISUMP domain-containing protein n=1 Tax=Paludibacter sp. 221 TaxID=2302939 RepID=UPI0013D1BC5E|nr:FISUMP domain-containing protein [Paludibacter sp. 221]NDV46588.1 hypothetical protein [Paludibacter sp. 221]